KTSLQGIRCNDKGQSSKEHRDNALNQHSNPGYPVSVDFAHHRRQAAIQAGDKKQPAKRVVVDNGVENKESNENQIDNHSEHLTGPTKAQLYSLSYSGWIGLIFERYSNLYPEGTNEVSSHYDNRSPEQIARDRTSVVDLNTHI